MNPAIERSRAGLGRTVKLAFAAAVERAGEALAAEGFGILCRIDVQATMKEKLGVDVPACLILGACNPPLAHAALEAVPEVALFLPCNVVVREVEDGVRVEAINAEVMAEMFSDPRLGEVAREVNLRLARVVAAIA